MGGWWIAWGGTMANDPTQGWHGSKSAKVTSTGVGEVFAVTTVAAVTSPSTQYTASLRFKGIAGTTHGLMLYSTPSWNQTMTTVVAIGTWQNINVTHTFNTEVSRGVVFKWTAAGAGEAANFDAIQLESGSTATPF